MFTINCKGKILHLNQPVVMGIINATPDSFYKGSIGSNVADIISLSEKMIMDGAAILDIGGQSTRPGSSRIEIGEEIKRVCTVIGQIRNKFPDIIISIDTYQSAVAKAGVDVGADMVNDVSGGEMDGEMLRTVAKLGVPYICMHMQGTPETMQKNPVYSNVVKEVLDYFIKKSNECKSLGIKDMIIDPGFGFGKTVQHNLELLRHLSVFQMLERPILAGLSRKGTICKILGVTAAEALNGTTVLNTLAIEKGASILRVHDVKEAKEVITLMTEYKKTASF